MKRTVFIMALSCLGLTAFAQQDTTTWKRFVLNPEEQSQPQTEAPKSQTIPVMQYWKEHNILQHLDLSLTLGTTGIGIDVASPIGDMFQVRAGYEFMPRFSKNMNFDLTINGEPARAYDADGNRQETTFDRLSEFMYQMTGYDVEDHVVMVGKPTINNFKFLIDVFPFKTNKHWHFTAGFYWGPSRFAYADNSAESMVSLLSAGIYNRMYEKAILDEPLFDFSGIDGIDIDIPVLPDVNTKFKEFGRLGFAVGYFKHDIYGTFPEDVYDTNGNLIHEQGEYGVIHKAGERYIMEPDDDGMVRVKAESNSFKPYVGFGYGGRLVKGRDDWKISFDCGAMFWGGTPSLYNHEGVDLANDVERIGGQVGDYVDLFKAFKVYPVLSLRITKTIF